MSCTCLNELETIDAYTDVIANCSFVFFLDPKTAFETKCFVLIHKHINANLMRKTFEFHVFHELRFFSIYVLIYLYLSIYLSLSTYLFVNLITQHIRIHVLSIQLLLAAVETIKRTLMTRKCLLTNVYNFQTATYFQSRGSAFRAGWPYLADIPVPLLLSNIDFLLA